MSLELKVISIEQNFVECLSFLCAKIDPQFSHLCLSPTGVFDVDDAGFCVHEKCLYTECIVFRALKISALVSLWSSGRMDERSNSQRLRVDWCSRSEQPTS